MIFIVACVSHLVAAYAPAAVRPVPARGVAISTIRDRTKRIGANSLRQLPGSVEECPCRPPHAVSRLSRRQLLARTAAAPWRQLPASAEPFIRASSAAGIKRLAALSLSRHLHANMVQAGANVGIRPLEYTDHDRRQECESRYRDQSMKPCREHGNGPLVTSGGCEGCRARLARLHVISWCFRGACKHFL